MKRTILLILILALGFATEVANADFTFGMPTNLGPTINSSSGDAQPDFSMDGLSLFFDSDRSGTWEIWMTTRATKEDPCGEPLNLGLGESGGPCISTDGLSLFFHSVRSGGSGRTDLWVTMRAEKDDTWSTPANLGPVVNSSSYDYHPEVSSDGLTLYFQSNRPGGPGGNDLWMTTRSTKDDPWNTPVNLRSTINTSGWDGHPNISADGLALFFASGDDIVMSTRATTDDDWGIPVKLNLARPSSAWDAGPGISTDGLILSFCSTRPGGVGDIDLWQAPIIPVVDLNADGIVDSADMCIIVDYWGTNESLCDIGPMPWGDGIVDVQDLIVLAEHLFEGIPPEEPEEVNIDENDADSQVELEQGQILVVTLESNPTTGYRWELAETQESILEQMGEAEFKQSDTGEPPLVGAGGWEIFSFKAISAGQMTLQLGYHRPWEEGVEPVKTFSIQVVVN